MKLWVITKKCEKKKGNTNIKDVYKRQVFAAVMFAVIRFPVWVLFGFGVLYFGIKSLKIELNEKMSWLWSAIMLGTGGIFTAYHIQYLLLDCLLYTSIKGFS